MIRWHMFTQRRRRRIRLRPQRPRLIWFVRFSDGGTFAVWDGPLPEVVGLVMVNAERYARRSPGGGACG